MKLLPMLLASSLAVSVSAPAAGQEVAEPGLRVTARNLTASLDPARAAAGLEGLREGDVVRFDVRFLSPAAQPIRDLALRNALPDGIAFVAGSARTDRADVEVEFSADGGASYAPRPTIAGGATGPVDPARYTHIRWTVRGLVEPGERIDLSFRGAFVGSDRALAPVPLTAR